LLLQSIQSIDYI